VGRTDSTLHNDNTINTLRSSARPCSSKLKLYTYVLVDLVVSITNRNNLCSKLKFNYLPVNN